MKIYYGALVAFCLISTSIAMEKKEYRTNIPIQKDVVHERDKDYQAAQIVRLQIATAQQDYEYCSNNFFSNTFFN
ncbi:hypothetical protein Noda2021_04880 [Candidatus Dependentiae bacterium Noda2021]|nr:hypothetical protein Noda2021_04880 [Candidatus Dependentiae bacterium Noda2021]